MIGDSFILHLRRIKICIRLLKIRCRFLCTCKAMSNDAGSIIYAELSLEALWAAELQTLERWKFLVKLLLATPTPMLSWLLLTHKWEAVNIIADPDLKAILDCAQLLFQEMFEHVVPNLSANV